MMSRKTIACVIGVFCMFCAEAAWAQPKWGRGRMPRAAACFFEDSNFRGRYFCVSPGERLRAVPREMGDKISSVRLLGASEVTVFRDEDMRGRSARFIGDVADLKREGWNDQISSVDVGRRMGGGWRGDRAPVWSRNQAMPREGACFYQDADFRGQYFCAPRGATYTSLPAGFNDRISSIRVIGSEVRVFQDRNFGGRSTEIRSDVPNLRGNWRDKVSSIRVF
jgi:hypothetical protein